MRRFYRIFTSFTLPEDGILTSHARDINFPCERCQLPAWGMLTSLMKKMNIFPGDTLFLLQKERFYMDNRLFSVYWSCTYFCILLSMSKIWIFAHIFLLAPVNGWKYAILGMRKMQSVKKRTQAMPGRFFSGIAETDVFPRYISTVSCRRDLPNTDYGKVFEFFAAHSGLSAFNT